jgi:hypothetical protein
MSAFALLAASLLVVPQSTEDMSRAMLRDYPSVSETRGQPGAVLLQVWVNPEGRAIRCEASTILGTETFAEAACDSRRRWRLAVPRTSDGRPTFGVFRAFSVFSDAPLSPEQRKTLTLPADIVLELASGITPALREFVVAVEIAPDGAMTHCEGVGTAPAALSEAACGEAAQYTHLAGKDADGNGVAYVQYLKIGLEAKSAS